MVKRGNEDDLILSKFNDRDGIAYSDIYTLIYKSLYYYAYSLYKETNIDCEDIIQDVFLNIWENKRLKFETIGKIKSYIFVVIKNKFLEYCRHQKFANRAIAESVKDNDFFVIQAVEADVYSIIPEALNMLPSDCAKSFKLFIEGYSVKEIAIKLDSPLSTIYSQKEKAISILRKKLPKYKLLLLIITSLK